MITITTIIMIMIIIIINNNKLFAELNGKPEKVMKYLVQIKVECFGVAYAVKVKNKRT